MELSSRTPGCADRRDKSAVPIAKQDVSIKPQRIVANAPHFEEVASDSGGLVSISSDAQQPSGYPALARLFEKSWKLLVR